MNRCRYLLIVITTFFFIVCINRTSFILNHVLAYTLGIVRVISHVHPNDYVVKSNVHNLRVVILYKK